MDYKFLGLRRPPAATMRPRSQSSVQVILQIIFIVNKRERPSQVACVL